jgi:photosystem II stability/assembly factor-like uncharacterized protein
MKIVCMIAFILILMLSGCSGLPANKKTESLEDYKNDDPPPRGTRISLTNDMYRYQVMLPEDWQASAQDGADLKKSASISLKNGQLNGEIRIGVCRGDWGYCVKTGGTAMKSTKEQTELDGVTAILFKETDKTGDGSELISQHVEAVRNGYTYDIYMQLNDRREELLKAYEELIRNWKWTKPEQTAAEAGDSVKLNSFRMVDDLHGWAESDKLLLSTSDGGRHWRDVTPPGSALPNGAASCFYNSNTAWIANYSEEEKAIYVYRTSDGGATWQKTSIPNPFDSGISLSLISMEFIDLRSGWLSVEPDHGMNSSPGLLLSTSDGGISWSPVSETDDSGQRENKAMPFGGYVRFRSREQGWIIGSKVSTGTSMIYQTNDNGLSWKKVDLPLPDGVKNGEIVPELPLFFSASSKAGLIPALFQPSDHSTANFLKIIFETSDNGKTWRGRTIPPEIGSVDSVSAYADNRHWYIWNSDARSIPIIGKLFRTENGGTDWTEIKLDQTLTAELEKNETIAEMQFTSAQTGWARLVAPNRSFAKLLKTTDGGRTWQAMDARLILSPSSH